MSVTVSNTRYGVTYYLDGRYHRDGDLPAISCVDGYQAWWRNGKRHRDNGPAIINDGNEMWFKDGNYHRVDGPAIIFKNGDKEWYWEGKRHREDGPAVERVDGTQKWYRYGKKIK